MKLSKIHDVLFLVVLVLLCAQPSRGYAEEPILYSRDVLYIVPKVIPEPIVHEDTHEDVEDKAGNNAPDDKNDKDKDATNGKTKKESTKPKPRLKKEVTVNIRPESYLEQPGVFNFQPFMDAGGLLVMLREPRRNALKTNNIYSSVDVIFIASDGQIMQIAPSITPSNLEESVDTEDDTSALLFLKAGESDSKDIRPGDRVIHSLFKSKPTVIKK